MSLKLNAPDTIPDLPIWPSGVARFADGILEITTGEGIRVAATDLLRIGVEPPRAGRLALALEYRAGLTTCKTSRWVEAHHEQALRRLTETVAAASGTTAAPSTSPRRRLRFGARAAGLAVLAVGGALAAAASAPPDASAAMQRYASPTGTGTDCNSAKPCTIAQAITGAGSGDEVIVSPGDYQLTATLTVPNQVTIHGVAGGPRPLLLFKGAGQSGMRLFPGAMLRHVEIIQDEPSYSALVSNGATVDQVVLRKSAGSQCTAVTVNNSTLRNSVVVASGSGATAVCARGVVAGVTSASWYRNVTAVATGSLGVAIEAYAAGQGSQALAELVNVIAKGGPNGAGLAMETDGSIGGKARITAIHTNFANYWHLPPAAIFVDGGGNQGSAPTFVNAASGDYRQAPGSVTIGAGVSHQLNGDFDLDGDPRAIGTTDIGADEFMSQQPAPTPPPPSPSPTAPAPPAPPVTSPPPAQPFAGVDLVSRKLTYARRAITVRLRCPAGTVGRCSGRTTLTARARRASARRVTLGRSRFSIAPGNRVRVKVHVTRAGRRLLNRTPRLRGRAVNVARDAAGQSKTIPTAVTIRRRSR